MAKLQKADNESKEKLKEILVAHFREKRGQLIGEWVELMMFRGFWASLSKEEIENESVAIYETCVNCFETGQFNKAETYARSMAERGALKGISTEQILSGMLTLRDVYSRSLVDKYKDDLVKLYEALDIYEPIGNKILSIVAMGFIEERERIVRQQAQAIRELSTPVLQVREGLLILPIIGLLDTQRARQLTENLLRSIRTNRALVVVLDITGVPTVDSKIANHLLQTIEAARLMGANIIVSGLSAETAQTVVTIGVDLSKMNTVSDLQSGIDQADKMLGYRVIRKNPSVEQ